MGKATREAYGNALARIGKENTNIIVLDADLSKSTKTDTFKGACPERFFNVGIAEQNLISVGAGLAAAGKIPFVSSFSMFAGHYKLNNLTAFVDFNGLQIDGDITKVLSPLPIPEKFKAFNWNVIEVNGHDLDELHNAIESAKAFTEGPTCIVMHTVKGKGVEEMEGQAGWHGKAPSEEQGVAFVNEIMGVQ